MFYVLCDDDCRHESMTKEQIITAIQNAIENGVVADPEGAIISKIKEIRANGALQFWHGTEAQFNALDPAPATVNVVARLAADGTIYFCSDDKTLEKVLSGFDNKADKTHTHTPEDLSSPVTIEKGGTDAATILGALENLKLLAKGIGIEPKAAVMQYGFITEFPWYTGTAMTTAEFIAGMPNDSVIFAAMPVSNNTKALADIPTLYAMAMFVKGGNNNYRNGLMWNVNTSAPKLWVYSSNGNGVFKWDRMLTAADFVLNGTTLTITTT